MNTLSESELAAKVGEILTRHESSLIFKRLRVRIRELGNAGNDEVAQFKQLQRACRESPELLADFVDNGFGNLTTANPRAPDAATGAVVQAFNRFIEASWKL